jgi:hypothetical protein
LPLKDGDSLSADIVGAGSCPVVVLPHVHQPLPVVVPDSPPVEIRRRRPSLILGVPFPGVKEFRMPSEVVTD